MKNGLKWGLRSFCRAVFSSREPGGATAREPSGSLPLRNGGTATQLPASPAPRLHPGVLSMTPGATPVHAVEPCPCERTGVPVPSVVRGLAWCSTARGWPFFAVGVFEFTGAVSIPEIRRLARPFIAILNHL